MIVKSDCRAILLLREHELPRVHIFFSFRDSLHISHKPGEHIQDVANTASIASLIMVGRLRSHWSSVFDLEAWVISPSFFVMS